VLTVKGRAQLASSRPSLQGVKIALVNVLNMTALCYRLSSANGARRKRRAQTMNKPSPTQTDERALIGCLIVYPTETQTEIEGLGLTVTSFTDPECRKLFDAATRLTVAGNPIDPATLQTESGVDVVIVDRFISAGCPHGHQAYHAQRVKMEHVKREAVRTIEGTNGNAAELRFALKQIDALIPTIETESHAVNACDLLGTRPPAPEYILEGVFEKMARVLLVGSSKTKKSFASAQLAVCVASGKDFCGVEIKRPHRVLLVNLENSKDWQHRRILNMCQALQIDAGALGDRLAILNGRGKGVTLEQIEREAVKHGAELIILDPLYKLDGGADECDQSERKRLIAELEAIGERTGAALVYVHHDGKGQAGDRDIRDRGAGSSIINRDVDATLALTRWGNQKDEDAENLTVLSVLARNSPPRPDLTLAFDNGAFFHDPDREPCKATSKQGHGRTQQGDPRADGKALAHWARCQGVATMTQLREKGSADFGAARANRALTYIKEHPQECAVTYALNEKTKQGYIGTAAGIEETIPNKEGFKVL